MFQESRDQQNSLAAAAHTLNQQHQKEQNLAQEAKVRTDETQARMLREAEQRMYGSSRQGIDGEVQKVQRSETAAATAAQVAQKAWESLGGSVEFDLKRASGLDVPFLERRDEEFLDAIRREMMLRAEPIEARQHDELEKQQQREKKANKQEAEDLPMSLTE